MIHILFTCTKSIKFLFYLPVVHQQFVYYFAIHNFIAMSFKILFFIVDILNINFYELIAICIMTFTQEELQYRGSPRFRMVCFALIHNNWLL